MKKFALLLLVLFISTGTFAQYYYLYHQYEKSNPGGYNSDAELPDASLPAGWTKIDNGGATSVRWTAIQTIPFTFNFNGNVVDKFKVSTSGILTFDTGAVAVPSYTKEALPSANIPNNSVCVWGIAGLAANDYIYTKVFGTGNNRQLWIHFNSYSYSASASDGSNYTYWSIVLEETSNKIYIVDQRTGGYAATKLVSAGIQINSTTATSITGSPNLLAQAGTDATPADNKYYEFIQGTQPQYDFAMNSITILYYQALQQAPYTIPGTLINYGSATITSFDINYSINGGSTVTGTINAVNIKTGDMYTFSHPTKWNPTTAGIYTIKVWASNLNGNADQVTSNDEKQTSVEVVDQMVQRVPLIEVYTSSTCPPCNPGNIQVTNTLNNYSKNQYTLIKFQQYYPGTGDPYFTNEGYDRHNYYGINSIPRVEIDGAWDMNPNTNFTQAVFDQYSNIPSFLDLKAYYWMLGEDVKLHIEMTPVKDFTGNLKLFAAVVENTTTDNIKTNGETEFYNVVKKMIPSQNGTTTGNLTKNVTKTYDLSWSFPGSYRLPTAARSNSSTAPTGTNYLGINLATENSVEEFTDLAVVVWVQDYGTTTKQVLQSTWAVDKTGIKENSSGSGIATLYPNPANSISELKFVLDDKENTSLDIINSVGQTVHTESLGILQKGIYTKNIDFTNILDGFYVLKLNVGNSSYTKKFIVKH
jgi:hypothetical protein